MLTHAADVSRPSDVKELVALARTSLSRLVGVVNNAGVYGPMGLVEEVEWAEWVKTIEINLFGTVLVCRTVLPHFSKQRYGKIVNLSGGGATGPLPRLSALWNPWEKLSKYRRKMTTSDVYTLRRIVPGDRGLKWEES